MSYCYATKEGTNGEGNTAGTYFCEACSLHCMSEVGLNQHLQTATHAEKLEASQQGKPVETNEDGTVKAKPELFYCDVCDITATCLQNLDMHNKGARHEKNLKRRDEGIEVPLITQRKAKTFVSGNNNSNDRAEIQGTVDSIEAPVVGLDYVIEVRRAGEHNRYTCNLCTVTCDSATVLTHVIGSKHRNKYLRAHHQDKIDEIQKGGAKKSEANQLLESYARVVEQADGRGTVKVQIDNNPAPYVPKPPKPAAMKRPGGDYVAPASKKFSPSVGRGQGGNKKNWGSAAPTGRGWVKSQDSWNPMGLPQSQPMPPGVGYGESLSSLLNTLTTCEISNEEEASLALKASTALSQALLQYNEAKTQSSGQGYGGQGARRIFPMNKNNNFNEGYSDGFGEGYNSGGYNSGGYNNFYGGF